MSIAGPSNISILTHQNKVWSAKRKQKREQVKEIVFDESARRDYLTGFHKRKLARKEASKAKAVEREKHERTEARRDKRRALAEQAVKNATEVERAYGAADSGDESDRRNSLAKSKAKADPEEMEFSNEEQLATVTIVEDFDPDDPTSTSHPGAQFTSNEDQQSRSKTRRPVRPAQGKTIVKAHKPPKPKFTYETKAARTYEKKKQAARRGEKTRFAKGRRIGKKNEKRQ